MADPGSAMVLDTIGAMMAFFVKYGEVQNHLGTKTDQPLKTAEGENMPEEYRGLTLRQLSEKVWSMMRSKSVQFAQKYTELGQMVNTLVSDLGAQIELQSILGEAPMDAEDLDQLIDASAFEESLGVLANHEALMKATNLLFHNLHSEEFVGKEVADLMKLKDSLRMEWLTASANVTEKNGTLAQLRGALEGKRAQMKAFNELIIKTDQSQSAKLQYLEDEVERLKVYKKQAEEDLKRYTYNMWGPFEGMWKNDVALAKEKVWRFMADIERREKQIEEVKGDSKSFDVKLEQSAVNQQEQEIIGNIGNEEKAMSDLQAAQSKLREELEQTDVQLRKRVAEQESVSVQNLIEASVARAHFANAVHSSSDVVTVGGIALFEQEVRALKGILNKTKKAKTVTQQRQLHEKMVDIIGSKPIWKLLMRSRLLTLMPQIPRADLKAMLEDLDEDEHQYGKEAFLVEPDEGVELEHDEL